MKRVEFSYLNYPILTACFHNEKTDIDIILLCQHGYNSDNFLIYFPELLIPLQHYSTDAIKLYLELEHDFGSADLTLETANRLSKQLSVMSIFVNCDRGIIDSNRLEDFCIAPFLEKLYPKSVNDNLKKMNIFIRETIFHLFSKYLKSNGYIVDIHSMWPFNIINLDDHEADLATINMSYLSIDNRGSKRKINFICNDIDGKLISSYKLARSLEEKLRSQNYLTEYNRPYYMLPMRSNYHYFSQYEGLAIDIPRDLLGKPNIYSRMNYAEMKKDKKLISKLGFVISEGIISSYRNCQ